MHNFVQPENLAEFMGRNEFGIKGVVHMGAISSTVATDPLDKFFSYKKSILDAEKSDVAEASETQS